MYRFFDTCCTKCCKCCGKKEQYTALELEEMEEAERKERLAIEVLRTKEQNINRQEDILLEESRRIQRQLENVQLQRFMFVHDNLALLRTHAAAFGMSTPAEASGSSDDKDKKGKGKSPERKSPERRSSDRPSRR